MLSVRHSRCNQLTCVSSQARPACARRAFLARAVPTLSAFWNDESAVTTIEYALLLMLIAVAGIATWWSFGATVRNVFHEGRRAMNEAGL